MTRIIRHLTDAATLAIVLFTIFVLCKNANDLHFVQQWYRNIQVSKPSLLETAVPQWYVDNRAADLKHYETTVPQWYIDIRETEKTLHETTVPQWYIDICESEYMMAQRADSYEIPQWYINIADTNQAHDAFIYKCIMLGSAICLAIVVRMYMNLA